MKYVCYQISSTIYGKHFRLYFDIIRINIDVDLLKQMIRGIMMDILQEYKELYYKEIEFKDTMNNKIGTSITFLTVLSTGHMFMWDIMIELQVVIHIIPILFLLLEIVSVFFTGVSMYNFYRAYFKYNYHLVSVREIKNTIESNNNLIRYYTKKEIDEANIRMMSSTFSKYAIINREENIRKNIW